MEKRWERHSRERAEDREIGQTEWKNEVGARGVAGSRGMGFLVCRVSYPSVSIGYAHSEDGRLPIDQLDFAR